MNALPSALRIALAFALQLALGGLSACTIHQGSLPPAQPPPPASVLQQVQGGGTVVVQRPTARWVRLSLFIDAGSRDAPSPAVATLAARWAAQQAGADARVLPDATELSLDCDLDESRLPQCVRALTDALGGKAPDEAQFGALLRGLERDRVRKGDAQAARLDRAALTALLGERAVSGWDPLAVGEAPPSRASVEAFALDHYGPGRALLVAAGDVDEDAVQSWSHGLRPARVRGRPSHPALQPEGRVRVVAADRPGLTLALSASSVDAAQALGRAFARQHPGTRATAFGVGAQALLLLRVPVRGTPWGELRTSLFDAQRLLLEGFEARPASDPLDVVALCRRTGEAWIHGSAGTPSSAVKVAAAVAYPPGSPVAPSDEEKAERALEEAAAKAESVQKAVADQLAPSMRGRGDDARAEVTLANGVRIEVERREGDGRFAASVQLDAGAALDPRDQHGRAALLATLSSSACAYASRPALAEKLRADGSRMRPLVSSSAYGVLAHGPAERWRSGVDRLLRCVLRPSFRARDLEDARLALLTELANNRGAEAAWGAARTLAPEAPGALAPWGSPEGTRAVGVGSLRTLHGQALRGGAVRVRLRVPERANDAAAFVARRLAQLQEGDAPEPPQLAPHAPRPLEGYVRADQPGARAWVGLAHPGALADDAAAFAAAEQIGYRLDALPGYALRAMAAGGRPFAFLWMELSVTDPEQLDALPAAVDAALAATRRCTPDCLETTVGKAQRRARAGASDPALELRAAFEAAASGAEGTRAVRELLSSRPTFVLLHPPEL